MSRQFEPTAPLRQPIANRRPVRGPFATNLIPPSRSQLDDVFPRIVLARNICSCSYGGADCLSWICITGHRSSPLDALAIAWLFPPFNFDVPFRSRVVHLGPPSPAPSRKNGV